MADWEFLLQKEGDRSWLPLDSPDVEILEGRYRIVARSNRPDAEVAVRVSHLSTAEDPPKRRIQKRSTRTNDDGLMVVIPFTRLEPGSWELQCASPNVMDDLVGDSWKHSLQIHVLAQEFHDEDWEPNWENSASESAVSAPASASLQDRSSEATPPPIAADPPLPTPADAAPEMPLAPPPATVPAAAAPNLIQENPELGQILGASMERLIQLTEQLSGKLVDELLQDFDLLPASGAAATPPSPVSAPVESAAAIASPTESPSAGYALPPGATFVLQLASEVFVANRSRALTIAGQIDVVLADATTPSDRLLVNRSKPSTADPWEAEAAIEPGGGIGREIQLCLRDPQTLQELVRDRQPLPAHAPPFSFQFSVTLPPDLKTRLILGEVLLCGALADEDSSAIVLTSQPFTITADPQELAEQLDQLNRAIVNHPEDDRADLPAELAAQITPENGASWLDLSFLNLVSAKPEDAANTRPAPAADAAAEVESPFSLSFLNLEEDEAAAPGTRFLAGYPLPPQIYRPDPNSLADKRIDLPSFGGSRSAKQEIPRSDSAAIANETPAVLTPPPETVTDEAPPDVPSEFNAEEENPVLLPVEVVEPSSAVEEAPEPLSRADVTSDPPTEEDVGADETPQNAPIAAEGAEFFSQEEPSPEASFEALRLQERFFSRLSSLATAAMTQVEPNAAPDRGSADDRGSVANRFDAAGDRAAAPLSSIPLMETLGDDASSGAGSHRLSQEFVVDDELPPPRPGSAASAPASKPDPEPVNPLLLPEDQPVPTPDLHVTVGELVAGNLVNLRVRLPNLLPRIYVKLWILDRQTRSLLSGPRWLVDFFPNGHDELEANTQLTVPFGSLAIRFEAIAVEIATQRESHKVSVERSVVPPNLPDASLDEFDF